MSECYPSPSPPPHTIIKLKKDHISLSCVSSEKPSSKKT